MTRALVLLAALHATAFGYDGKYAGDPRFRALSSELPKRYAEARRRIAGKIGAEVPDFPLVVEDAGADRSGVWAETRDGPDGPELVLKAEYLVLGAHDLDRTLDHELVHCLQRRAGDYAELPAWAREGSALFLAGQGDARMRALAALAGIEEGDTLADRFANGLAGPHDLRDYAEDYAAFAQLGPERGLALARAFLARRDVDAVLKEFAGRPFDELDAGAGAYAKRMMAPLFAEGLDALRDGRARLEADDAEGALALLVPRGVHAPATATYRAVALHRLGRGVAALRTLREDALGPDQRAWNPLLERALRLELTLLEALDHPEVLEYRRRAKLDWTVFGS